MSKLILIPTPIGNLGDITQRAVECIKTVDILLCEDTRRSLKLLNHLKIKKPLKSYHKFNEHSTVGKVIGLSQEAVEVWEFERLSQLKSSVKVQNLDIFQLTRLALLHLRHS